MTVSNYNTTASSNTAINGVNISEGMSPSDVNNAIRQELKDVRDVWNDKEWFLLGSGSSTVTYTRASSTSVTINADVSTTYHVGRRIKITGTNTGTIYGKIATSSYSSPNTTVAFTFDSGTINASDSTVSVFVGSTYVGPSIPVIHDTSLGTSQILPPSQGAVKTYVDAQVTAQDLDFEGDSGSSNVDLDSQSLDIAGGSGITTTASGQTLTVAGDDATTSAKGVASFSSDNFAVSSGAVTIKDGGVVNAELANSSVNYGGVSLSLGGSDTTPAFNLVDATGYPGSSITGTIGNSQVATGIDAAKLADGTVSNTEFQYINSLSSNAQTQLGTKLTASNNLSDIGTASTARTNLGLGDIATQAASSVAITGGSISGLGSPGSASSAVPKSYVDDAVAGLRTRIIAECASTANVNISNALEAGDSIDGVVLVAGDRVLLKDQSDATENGLYLAVGSGAGAASRDPEHDTIAELSGGMVVVNQGTANDNKIFLCTTDSDGSIGSTNITYTVITPSNTGTVTSIGLTQSGSEFTISGTPVTSSGNITIDVNRISATKIGGGTTVSDTEYGYLANVSSDIQTQLDAKSGAGFAVAMAIAL
jgi:hypothetical protein